MAKKEGFDRGDNPFGTYTKDQAKRGAAVIKRLQNTKQGGKKK